MNDVDQTIYGFGIGFILGSFIIARYGSLTTGLIVGTIGWIILISKYVYNVWKFEKNLRLR